MRDPKRIKPFMERLQKYWYEYFPDWRFGQLISNFMRFLSVEASINDTFYIEDEEMLKYLDKFVDSLIVRDEN